MKAQLGLDPQLLSVNLPAARTERVDVPNAGSPPDIPQTDRMNGRMRFAGEALRQVEAQPMDGRFTRKRELNNPQMGMIKNRGSIQAEISPGGDLEPQSLEGFDV